MRRVFVVGVTAARLWIVEPTLLFVESCAGLGFAEAVLLGWELCGRYRKVLPGDRREDALKAGFSKAEAATTPDDIHAFLESVPDGLYGAKVARRALVYVRAGARSPMEAAVALLLIAPPELGGFGLPEPIVNGRLPLDPRFLALTYEASFEMDLLWLRKGKPPLVVEIDGYGSHRGSLSKAQAARDAMKQNEAVLREVTVLRLAGTEITEADRFLVNARNIAAQLDFELAIDDPGWQDRFEELHAAVMNKEYVPSEIYDVPEAYA